MTESRKHQRTKEEIFRGLVRKSDCAKVMMERRLDGVRPDVSLYVGDTPVAIEVQRSDISTDEIARRSIRYSDMGISVLWVLPDVSRRAFDAKEWQKFLHAMYYGRLYIHHRRSLVLAGHLLRASRWVPPSDFGGGYMKTYKIKRQLHFCPRPLDIARDFTATSRNEWDGFKWTVPSCSIWKDVHPRWWSA